jgi:hypothetical protein
MCEAPYAESFFGPELRKTPRRLVNSFVERLLFQRLSVGWVDSDIERPVSATSAYGRSPMRLADMKDTLRLSVVAHRSKSEAPRSRF